MSLPTGLSTVTVTCGPYVDAKGAPYTGTVTFTPSTKVRWAATGAVVLDGTVNVPIDTTGVGQVTLPATDAAGLNVTGFTYSVAYSLRGAGGAVTGVRAAYSIQIPAAAPTVTLELLQPFASTGGIDVSVPAVTSVAGLTGAVSASDLTTALGGVPGGGGGGGGGVVSEPVADATAVTKGILQLTGDLAGTASSPIIATGAVTSAKLAAGAVGAAALGAGAVTSAKLAPDLKSTLPLLTPAVSTTTIGTLVAGAVNRITPTAAATRGLPDAVNAGAGAIIVVKAAANPVTITSQGSIPSLVGTSGGTSNGLTLPGGIQAGDVILLVCASYTLGLAVPAGFTLLATAANATSGSGQATIFYKVAAGTESSSSIPGITNNTGMAAVVVRGANGTAPFDPSKPTATFGYQLTHTPPSITTSSACYLLFIDSTTQDTTGGSVTGPPILNGKTATFGITIWGATQSGAGTTACPGTVTFGSAVAGSGITIGLTSGVTVSSINGTVGASRVVAAGETVILRSDGVSDWADITGGSPVSVLDARYDAAGAATAVDARVTALASSMSNTLDRSPVLWPFSVDSIWNLPVATTARFEKSTDTMTAALLGASGTPWMNSEQYSHPVTQASDSDPLATVTDFYEPTRSGIFRVPANATIAGGGDQHMHIVDPLQVWVHECFGTTRNSPTSYTVGRHEASNLYGPGAGPIGGTRAYGGSAIGGLIRKWEVDPTHPAYTGEIRHALAIALGNNQLYYNSVGSAVGQDQYGWGASRGYVWPATEQDYDSPYTYFGVIPMGSFCAIPSWVNVEALPLSAAGKMVARAMQRYGVYVTDRSAAFTMYVEPGTPTSWLYPARDNIAVLRAQLRIVTNSGKGTPGGGVWLGDDSNRVAPLAPPLPPLPKGA